MFEIEYYRDASGKKPVESFIDGLDLVMKPNTFGLVELLERYGPELGMPFSRHLEDGIFEFRVVRGSDSVRILYFFVVGKRVVLTHGFRKKTQKARHAGKSKEPSRSARIGGREMNDFRRHLEASLKDPAFKEEWDVQAVEREVARSIVEARMREGLTQQELARRSGMMPANLCRLENGNGNPSVATLSKIASGLGCKLEIRFV